MNQCEKEAKKKIREKLIEFEMVRKVYEKQKELTWTFFPEA